jgi:hypothetical protein
MSKKPPTNDALKARAEAAGLLNLNPRRLSPIDVLRCDLVATLRATIDHTNAELLAGGATATVLAVHTGAIEQLRKLLPADRLEPQEHRSDPRRALLALIMRQREHAGIPDEGIGRDGEVAALKAEIAQLKARLGDAPMVVEFDPDPPRSNVVPTSDITPPSEQAARDPGPRPGPDDPRPPTVIDVDAVDLRAGFSSDNSDQSWRNFATDVDGVPLTGRGKYWGPVR